MKGGIMRVSVCLWVSGSPQSLNIAHCVYVSVCIECDLLFTSLYLGLITRNHLIHRVPVPALHPDEWVNSVSYFTHLPITLACLLLSYCSMSCYYFHLTACYSKLTFVNGYTRAHPEFNKMSLLHVTHACGGFPPLVTQQFRETQEEEKKNKLYL